MRAELAAATARLRAAGVPSPRVDAELLAAHLLGVPRTRLALVDAVDPEVLARYRDLIERRARRIPLQYLTGVASLGELEVAVGPGVFVPRPETELLLDRALREIPDRAVVLDLCTGSGALALALAHARPDAAVHAVELDPRAMAWARRNAADRARAGDTPIALHAGDVTDPTLLPELAGAVDLALANPPYVPSGARLEPEVAEHEPPHAVFAGTDGLDVIRPLIGNLARWLRPGGTVAIEHDDGNGGGVAGLFAAAGGFDRIAEHTDLAGRPRFVVARRVG